MKEIKFNGESLYYNFDSFGAFIYENDKKTFLYKIEGATPATIEREFKNAHTAYCRGCDTYRGRGLSPFLPNKWPYLV